MKLKKVKMNRGLKPVPWLWDWYVLLDQSPSSPLPGFLCLLMKTFSTFTPCSYSNGENLVCFYCKENNTPLLSIYSSVVGTNETNQETRASALVLRYVDIVYLWVATEVTNPSNLCGSLPIYRYYTNAFFV